MFTMPSEHYKLVNKILQHENSQSYVQCYNSLTNDKQTCYCITPTEIAAVKMHMQYRRTDHCYAWLIPLQYYLTQPINNTTKQTEVEKKNEKKNSTLTMPHVPLSLLHCGDLC